MDKLKIAIPALLFSIFLLSAIAYAAAPDIWVKCETDGTHQTTPDGKYWTCCSSEWLNQNSCSCTSPKLLCGTPPACVTPVCTTDAGCDDGNSNTIDKCNNAGDCDVSCSHTPLKTLTLSANPTIATANGATTSTITASTSDTKSNVVVSFETTIGTLTPSSPSTCTTDITGSCAVTISSSTTGDATITGKAINYIDGSTTVTFIPPGGGGGGCARSNPTITVDPASQQANPGEKKSYTVKITNNDQNCGAESFSLFMPTVTGWTFDIPASLSINSGSTGTTTLDITSPSDSGDTILNTWVKATNTNDNNYYSSANVIYKIVCTYSLSIKPMQNFDTSTKIGTYTGVKYTWSLSFSDSSSSSCPGTITYKIPSLTQSGSCDISQTGIYASNSNPPNGLKLSTPYSFSIARGGGLDNAFKVFVKKNGPDSCTLSFPINNPDGIPVDPSFTLTGGSTQAPYVSSLDFSGDKNSFNVRWTAFYPDDQPFRDMKVKCALFNPADNSCDPEKQDCGGVAGKGCLPYDASQGTQDAKIGGCDVASPAFDYTQNNKIICLFYDPAKNSLKTRTEPSFTPINFDIQAADKIITTVGHPFDLRVDVGNKGALKDSYKIEVSGSNTVDISPASVTTQIIDRGQTVSAVFSITPLVNQENTIAVKVTSLTSGKIATKNINISPGLFALPEFGLGGFLQIIVMAAAVYFLLFNRLFKANRKRR